MAKKLVEIQPIFLTPEKITEIKTELTEIEQHILPEIRKRLASAYEDGDIPENNPFITANEDMQLAMKRRNELLHLLARSKAYKESDKKKNKVGLGSVLTIRINNSTPQTITLVSSEEANPLKGKISVDSPIGRGILQNVGQAPVTIETPGGILHLTIL